MSQHRLRHFVAALICGVVPLIPLIPLVPVQASTPTRIESGASPATNAARPVSASDIGPPVMQRASDFEANAPIRSYQPAQVQGVRTVQAPSNARLFREVFGFALASSLSDPTLGYPTWNFSLLSTVAFFISPRIRIDSCVPTSANFART